MPRLDKNNKDSTLEQEVDKLLASLSHRMAQLLVVLISTTSTMSTSLMPALVLSSGKIKVIQEKSGIVNLIKQLEMAP